MMTMPQLDVAFFPSQILWLVITFAALYWYVKHHILPKIDDIVLRRAGVMNSNVSGAEQLQMRIQSLQKQCAEEALYTQTQIEEVHHSMMKDFGEHKQRCLAEIESNFHARQNVQLSDIAKAQKNVDKDMPDAVIGCASTVITKVTGAVPNIDALRACYNGLEVRSDR